MSESVTSIHGVPIRLPAERWSHVTDEHPELAGLLSDVLTTVGQPQRVVAGERGERFALRALASGHTLVVVYREIDPADGFVITAFLTRRLAPFDRRPQLWPPKPLTNT